MCAACLAAVQAALAESPAGADLPREPGQAAYLHRAEAKYTMHAERLLHASFAGGPGAPEAVAAAAGDAELGENVELF